MPAQSLTFVTVVFEPEFPLLRLQARSVERYVPEHLLHEIIVIDNSARGMGPGLTQALREDLGAYGPLLRILRPADLGRVPRGVGWRSQQALKLTVAQQIRSDRYLLLDAKNHFIAPLTGNFLEAEDGKPRANAYSYEQHPMRRDLEHVLAYLGLDPDEHVGHFTATVTPFVLDTALVRRVVADIEQDSGRPFVSEFVGRDLIEFFLYAGWILRSGGRLEHVYSITLTPSVTIWPRLASVEGVAQTLVDARNSASPVFAVHRNALARLDESSAHAVAAFWLERGLFPTMDAATLFIDEFQTAFEKEARRQRLRDLPRKVRTLPRAVKRRLVRRFRIARSQPAAR